MNVGEVAALAGVTVRALHHYDRLGLLKPARRTAAGYRVYSESDFARLQQIVTLKSEVDRLAQPPAAYGIILESYDDATVETWLVNWAAPAERRLHERGEHFRRRIGERERGD